MYVLEAILVAKIKGSQNLKGLRYTSSNFDREILVQSWENQGNLLNLKFFETLFLQHLFIIIMSVLSKFERKRIQTFDFIAH